MASASAMMVLVRSARSFWAKKERGSFLSFSAREILLAADSLYVDS